MSQTHPVAAAVPATFEALGLSPQALEQLARAGFLAPTPIQARAIPPALAGKDVVGCAATGTGKTAAFVLPLIERLAGHAGTRALILAPTRELALQIADEIDRFSRGRHVRSAVIIGGLSIGAQAQQLRERRSVIVATPGRLVDHLQQGNARLDQIELLILDEADRMLDMGFAPQLKQIMGRLPPRAQKPRQTLLFSATMAGEVANFAKANLINPVRVEVDRSGTAAPRVDQKVYLVSQAHKTALLLALLDADKDSTLVFTRTTRRADKITRQVQKAGHAAAAIHADRSQGQRRQAMEGFKRGQHRILIATDIAARGIDVADIGHVINYDLPHVAEDYVHRIGRTARAAKSGRASAFAAPDEMDLLRGIERFTRTPIVRAEVPRASPVFQAEAARAAAAPPPTHHSSGPKHHQAHKSGSHPPRSGGSGRPQAHPHHAGAKPAGGSPGGKPTRVGAWRPKRQR